MTKITSRVSDKTSEWLTATFKTKTAGSEYLLDALPMLYARVLHSLAGRFNLAELQLVLDVSNGLILVPGMSGQHIIADVEDGITMDKLDRKWKVSGPELVSKIKALSWFERACLEIWARSFWEHGDACDAKGLRDWCSQLA